MTYEEAVKLLREAPIMGVKVKDSPLPLAKAVEIAIDALEKQIPKKPKVTIINGFKSYHCPICDSTAVHRGGCGDCLQAIDWGDAE